jgi:hypothetical protein
VIVSRDELAAYADGELTGEAARKVEAALAADPALLRDLERHRALKAQLAAQQIGESLRYRLFGNRAEMRGAQEVPADNVVGLAEARERIEAKRRLPRWSWIAGPALAASLALVVLLPRGDSNRPDYADVQLAGLLDDRLVAEQVPGSDIRVLLSFRNDQGSYCRAFSGGTGGGIACRDTWGWKLEALGKGSSESRTDYRMAGASDAAILARAQAIAVGPALDAEEEAAARARGWR